jgi:hypothetical protein
VKISREASERDVTYAFEAFEAGAYRIFCEPGRSTVRMLRASHRVCVAAVGGPAHFLGIPGELFVRVPAGVKQFGLKVMGSDFGERAKAALVDPAGKVVEERDAIALPHVFVGRRADASKEEVWSLRVGKPSVGVLEDFYIDVLGVPPLLAGSRGALLRPAR